jgi:hypothetical protein
MNSGLVAKISVSYMQKGPTYRRSKILDHQNLPEWESCITKKRAMCSAIISPLSA